MAKDNNDIIGQLLQEVFTGRDGLKRVLEVLVNQAMQSEITRHLEAEQYQRTDHRRGYRNGVKSRQLATGWGPWSWRCPRPVAVTGGNDSVYLGGLVGYDNNGSYTKGFWDNTVNAGLSGIGNTSDPNVIGETTENMQKAGTFTSEGWDFVGDDNGDFDYWRMCIDDLDYPKLSWQFLDGDLVCPDGVGMGDLAYWWGHWLDIDCDVSNNYYYRADLNFSGSVDLVDFGRLGGNWLKK